MIGVITVTLLSATYGIIAGASLKDLQDARQFSILAALFGALSAILNAAFFHESDGILMERVFSWLLSCYCFKYGTIGRIKLSAYLAVNPKWKAKYPILKRL